MIELHADFETRSDINLTTRGAGPYFASPHWKALILAYAIDDGAIRDWTFGQPCPADLRQAIEAGAWIRAHEADFERQCFDQMAGRHGWPRPAFDRYRCSMATASALGLPRSLARLGAALGLAVQKDKRGAALIRKFSVPRAPGPVWNEPDDHPQEFAEFVAYCRRDVETEMEAERRMIPLSDDEQAVYTLSETINARGVRIDRRSAAAAIALVEKAKAALDQRMRAVTGGAVPACTQVAKLTEWCASRGVALEGVAKDDIIEALDLEDLSADVREALMIRQEAGKSSTSKLKAFLNHADADDRVRQCFVYHGAAPGRWSSAGGVNFSNLPRPRAIFDDADLDQAVLFQAFRSEDPGLLKVLYGEDLGMPLHLVSDAIRGFLIAAPGHDFVAVDYSGIQGALCAWLAGERRKLTAMQEIIDDPSKPDLYRRAAAGILNTTTEVITKKHWGRQLGKVSELALGFQGSVAAYVSMAANYGMRLRALHDLYPGVWAAASLEAREKAVKRYERCLKARNKVKTDVLTREAWLACELIKIGWRNTNPAIADAWGKLEAAMRDAMRSPGRAVRALGRVDYLFKSGFLWCRLPSGRCIAYASPKLKDQVWAKLLLEDGSWSEAEVVDRDDAEKWAMIGKAQIQGATSPKVTALGVNSTTQKLERYAVYGGLAMENLAMSLERDILVCGMRNCEAAGYPIVSHTYDEAVAEVPRGFGSVDEMERLMLDLPGCYAGLPLAAHGWRGKRYRK